MGGRGDDAVGISAADDRPTALCLTCLPMAQRRLGGRLHREQRLERCLPFRLHQRHVDGDWALWGLPKRTPPAEAGSLKTLVINALAGPAHPERPLLVFLCEGSPFEAVAGSLARPRKGGTDARQGATTIGQLIRIGRASM